MAASREGGTSPSVLLFCVASSRAVRSCSVSADAPAVASCVCRSSTKPLRTSAFPGEFQSPGCLAKGATPLILNPFTAKQTRGAATSAAAAGFGCQGCFLPLPRSSWGDGEGGAGVGGVGGVSGTSSPQRHRVALCVQTALLIPR